MPSLLRPVTVQHSLSLGDRFYQSDQDAYAVGIDDGHVLGNAVDNQVAVGISNVDIHKVILLDVVDVVVAVSIAVIVLDHDAIAVQDANVVSVGVHLVVTVVVTKHVIVSVPCRDDINFGVSYTTGVADCNVVLCRAQSSDVSDTFNIDDAVNFLDRHSDDHLLTHSHWYWVPYLQRHGVRL